MLEKRYQIWTKSGISWSKWYPYFGEPTKWQLSGKLLNEFREIASTPETSKKENFLIRKSKKHKAK